jgi:predicted AAA+ superfamily ATPase
MIPRAYHPLGQYLKPNKVLILYGARQVGKTTLLQSFLAETDLKYRLDSGEDIRIQLVLGSQDFRQILQYAEGYDLIALDEAQNIPHIGRGLKILVDQVPGLHIIATGSSSFELAGQVGEPLTGRKRTLVLYPLSQSELLGTMNRFDLRHRLEDFLIFGAYPDVVTAATREERIAVLDEIAGSYLLKDILAFDRVRNPQVVLNLLRLLAFQIGSEVSLNELATQLGVNTKTVQRYLDLLEKSFVITSLGGFSRNLRNEVTSKRKYYYLDNGIRNAVIAQFADLGMRNDVGQLWENFFVIERIKWRSYAPLYAHAYYWRTYSQQEIDMVEDRDGILTGFECKWSPRRLPKTPKAWMEGYPNTGYEVVTPENYLDFLTPAA